MIIAERVSVSVCRVGERERERGRERDRDRERDREREKRIEKRIVGNGIQILYFCRYYCTT